MHRIRSTLGPSNACSKRVVVTVKYLVNHWRFGHSIRSFDYRATRIIESGKCRGGYVLVLRGEMEVPSNG